MYHGGSRACYFDFSCGFVKRSLPLVVFRTGTSLNPVVTVYAINPGHKFSCWSTANLFRAIQQHSFRTPHITSQQERTCRVLCKSNTTRNIELTVWCPSHVQDDTVSDGGRRTLASAGSKNGRDCPRKNLAGEVAPGFRQGRSRFKHVD